MSADEKLDLSTATDEQLERAVDDAEELPAAKSAVRPGRDALSEQLDHLKKRFVWSTNGQLFERVTGRTVRPVEVLGRDGEREAIRAEIYAFETTRLGCRPAEFKFTDAEGHCLSSKRTLAEEVHSCLAPGEPGLCQVELPGHAVHAARCTRSSLEATEDARVVLGETGSDVGFRELRPAPGPGGGFPGIGQILGRLAAPNENGELEAIDPVSMLHVLAVFGGIFLREESRQVVLMQGAGGDGKGTLIRSICEFFGKAKHDEDDIFRTESKHWAAPLVGKHLLVVAELEAGRIFSNRRLKALSGGDALPVEIKFGPRFSMPNRLRIILASNAEQELTDTPSELSRCFPLQFLQRNTAGQSTTDKHFEKRCHEEVGAFAAACAQAYSALCPTGGDVPLTPALERLRESWVENGDERWAGFADRFLEFGDGFMLRGSDLEALFDERARYWRKGERGAFKKWLAIRVRQSPTNRNIRPPGGKSEKGFPRVRIRSEFRL